LRADIARHVGQKGQLCAERFQLVDLVESVRIKTKRAREPELSLLEGEVPEEAERGFPAEQSFLLLGGWIDPKLEPLVAPHEKKNTLVCKKSKRIRQPETQLAFRRALLLAELLAPESSDGRHSTSSNASCSATARQGFLPVLKDGVSARGAN